MELADDLERLSRLHAAGELSDAEYADAKQALLHPTADGGTTAPEVPADLPRLRLDPPTLRPDPRPEPGRGRGVVVAVGAVAAISLFIGFMTATAGFAFVPSMAKLTAWAACPDGHHHITVDVDYRGYGRSNLDYACVSPSGDAQPANGVTTHALLFAYGTGLGLVLCLPVLAIAPFRRWFSSTFL